MAFEFQIEERATQHAVTMRTQVSIEGLPAFFDQAFGRVIGHIAQAGQAPTGPAFALYHTQDPTNFDLEAGFPVAEPIAGNGEILASEIPGGKVCVTMLVGPYERLPEAWEALAAYADAEGLEPDTWCYEVYISDPTTVPPDQRQTQLVMPIK